VLDLGTPGPALAQALSGRSPVLLVHAAPVLPAAGPDDWLRLAADEEALPFAPASFDLVVSALALQGVNDLPGALLQIRRALAPDGLFMGCLIGGQSLQELRLAFAEAEEAITGGVSPRVAPFADLRDMGGLLQRAGFALPVTDVDTITVRYGSIFGLLRDLRAMGATNALVARDRRPLRRAVLMRAAEIYHSRFADPDGRLRATFEFVWLSGWAPHESQQKPLQPGSAKARLADALGAVERKI
jgi:SAM-dependent methyltransferase